MKTIRYCFLFMCLIASYCSYGVSVREVLQAHPEIQIDAHGSLNLQNHDIDSLEGLNDIHFPNTLSSLNLSNNHLVQLPDGAFQHFPSLRELNLEHNDLEVIGNNLFATQRVYVNVAHNRLSQVQIQQLARQIAPYPHVQELVPAVNRIYSGLSAIFLSLVLYPSLKYALSKARLTKANFVLDALVHGANIVSFIYKIRHAGFRDCLNCVENGVHIYNSYKSPFTVADEINNNFAIDLKSFTTHPLIWLASWLPFCHRLPAVPRHMQDAMMIPWTLCPSKCFKFLNGVSGMSKILSLGIHAEPHRGGVVEGALRRVARMGTVDAAYQLPAAVPAQVQ